jgi:hypothetical protein
VKLCRANDSLFRQQNIEQAELTRTIQNAARGERERAAGAFTLFNPKTFPNPTIPMLKSYDAFISHATEDKQDVARPLAEELIRLGNRIWYDEFELKVGDSLRRSIDRGLAASKFGIVILSPAFFAKNWPQYELDGLVAKEMTGGKIILPIWHKVSKNEVIGYSPSLADKVALHTAMHTIQELAEKLGDAMGEGAPGRESIREIGITETAQP